MRRFTFRSASACLVLALAIAGCANNPEPVGPTSSSNLSGQSMAPLLTVNPQARVPDHYIVVMNDEATGLSQNGSSQSGGSDENVNSIVNAMAFKYGLQVDNVYDAVFHGFSATVPAGHLDALRQDARVKYVEEDQVMTADGPAPAQTLPWGVDKIGGDSSSTVSGNRSGAVSTVRIYIIDTGIQTNHPDLNVVGGRNFAGGSTSAYGDGYGHGTHCAGIAAAKDNTSFVVGVCPGAALYAVRVLDNTGNGTNANVIAGVNWVKQQKQGATTVPMVANMSLGGGVSSALDSAVASCISAGVTVCVAAGNSGADASTSSPARVPSAITVGAYDSTGTMATWSNYGSVVDINAPGVNIPSTWLNSGMATISGTSMAAPHVTGAVALFLSHSANAASTPAQVATRLTGDAHTGINVLGRSTTNLSLYIAGRPTIY